MVNSRSGDRFHYVWAAVQSLKLLDRQSELRQVWVEGAAGEPVPGDEIIDLAEYYGTRDAVDRVIVRQLKYSTKRATKDLGLSELGPTFRKFSQIDNRKHAALRIPATAHTEYVITSNRPIGSSLRNAIEQVVAGNKIGANSIASKLLGWLETDQRRGSDFLRRLIFDGAGSELAALQAQLEVLTAALTGEADSTVPSVLLDQVSRRASGQVSGPIDLSTVAMAFGVTVEDLVPAPSLIPAHNGAVARAAYRELANLVLRSAGPTIISAVGGAGKTTFAASLPTLLEKKAVVVIYDCFGNGSYRAPDKPRHRHRDGLVQIASELAAQALSAPLIPRAATGSAEYMKAFIQRLREARRRLAESAPGTELVIVVDAADNGVIAAEARGDQAFVHDLLQVEPIDGVHLVVTARPYRVTQLRAPSDVAILQLAEFSIDETASMLRAVHPHATDNDIAEFHRRTSANPRIQALVLTETATLRDCLNSLTGLPAAGNDPVSQLLGRQLDTVLETAGGDRGSLEFAGQLLATLRPRIPIEVIASLTGRDESLIRSFVSDLGRGLVVEDDAVQFLDEPTETFFRSRYPLSDENADRVIRGLTRLSSSHGYAAASLPQVLWEAGRFEDLAALALSDAGLPAEGEVERRQIAQLRTSFALRAAIRVGNPAAVVELAMIAGAAAASSERRYTLLRDHADLAGEVIDGTTLDEIRAAHLFPSEWPGSVLNAEAVMLTMKEDRRGDALNRLRGARAAIDAWVQTSSGDREGKLVPRHGANIALATAWLQDEPTAARYLEGWQPDRWVFEQSRSVVSILLARGEQDRVTRLGVAARTSSLSLAIAAELQKLGLPISRDHAERAWRTLRGARVGIDHEDSSLGGISDAVYRGVAWITAYSVRSGIATIRQGLNLLTKYLPKTTPRGLGDYHGRDNAGLLSAYALRAALLGRNLAIEDLEPSRDGFGRSAREEENAQLTRLLPWLQGWAGWALGRSTATGIRRLLDSYPTERSSYRDPVLLRRIAGPMTAQFARSSRSTRVASTFEKILASAQAHSGLFVATDMIASLQGDARFVDPAYICADASAVGAEAEQQTADQMADDLVRIARAIYVFDEAEAHAYFGKAVAIVSRVGDDTWQRWESIVALARGAVADDPDQRFLLAKHLADSAERLEPYMYSGFDTTKLLAALQIMTGPRTFAIVSQWRDRQFGSFGSLIGTIRDQADGILAGHPELRIALAAFSDGGGLGDELASLAATGSLTDERFSAVQQLAWARGGELAAEDLDPRWAERYGLRQRPLTPDRGYVNSTWDDPGWETKRQKEREAVRKSLHTFDLGSPAGMAEAAAAIREAPYGADASILIDEVERRPKNTWASILGSFSNEDSFSVWQRAEFIRGASQLESSSRAFRTALRELGNDYLGRHSADVTSGFSLGLEIGVLAAVLETDERSVLLRALELTDAEVAVASADSCYRLAGGVAPLLDAADAVRALTGALRALETALEIDHWSPAGVVIPATADSNSAVAATIWSALADPRASTRWRAIHATRFLIAFGAGDAVQALTQLVLQEAPAGFLDSRFPFYRWHAVEGFLVAAERAAVDNPSQVSPLLASIAALSTAHPDHARIQYICAQIANRCGDASLIRLATIQRASLDDVRRFERPDAPKPFGHHAVKSEFSFQFDFEEYAIAPLSESFRTTHHEVVRAMSGLILDEWGYRGSLELADPRREAGAYESEETYFYKHDVPKAEDLAYYLSYHAMLTVAGRLLRTTTRFRDPDDGTDAFDEWFTQFDLGREDRRWIADARRPVPPGHERRQQSYGDEWLWKVTATDFIPEFLNADGWVTVRSAAHQSGYGTSDNTYVTSSLVAPDTSMALMRALQAAPSFNNHRLPLADDDDFTFDNGSFQLRGWIDSPYRESGVDRRDDFARDVRFPTPRPSGWVLEALELSSSEDGMSWSKSDGVLAGTAESWSLKDSGREPSGPDGTRLRVSPALLANLATHTGMAVIVEVRIDRSDESTRSNSNHDSLGYLDDYVKFFLFTPDAGWRDARGHPVTGSADRGQP
ncbi:hypothetical protein [Rathayibacter sp. VKM Ac-2754]|uniref:hypothetical protein n=1 Tax=Rathayibacter sp. VKM Ac-2754 TaxID=2609251 RepID=UPI0013599860|nr:hypothetical protein [Rathayibacter sp. VKM Ac-2754]MWV57423.1 hypothetical protein [Rathayibacter sp. VKM Ac-2754]